MSKRKNTNNSSTISRYLKLQLCNTLIYLAVFLLFSVVCVKADVAKENMMLISLSFIGIASFLSGFSAGLRERKNGIVCGILSPLPVNLIVIGASILLNGFRLDLHILYTVTVCLVMSALGGIISVNIRLK